MVYSVKFQVKNVRKGDAQFNVMTERHQEFDSITLAVQYVKQIANTGFSNGEVLVGKPIIDAGDESDRYSSL